MRHDDDRVVFFKLTNVSSTVPVEIGSNALAGSSNNKNIWFHCDRAGRCIIVVAVLQIEQVHFYPSYPLLDPIEQLVSNLFPTISSNFFLFFTMLFQCKRDIFINGFTKRILAVENHPDPLTHLIYIDLWRIDISPLCT